MPAALNSSRVGPGVWQHETSRPSTTTDGTANPIVWMLGAEGDNRLHGFRGDTGERLFASPPLVGLRHFQTLIAADDRLFVGADGRLYAFTLP